MRATEPLNVGERVVVIEPAKIVTDYRGRDEQARERTEPKQRRPRFREALEGAGGEGGHAAREVHIACRGRRAGIGIAL